MVLLMESYIILSHEKRQLVLRNIGKVTELFC
jgi:hypothetical protein